MTDFVNYGSLRNKPMPEVHNGQQLMTKSEEICCKKCLCNICGPVEVVHVAVFVRRIYKTPQLIITGIYFLHCIHHLVLFFKTTMFWGMAAPPHPFCISVYCLWNAAYEEFCVTHNFAAKCWQNQRRKWYGCFEWRRFHWCEKRWGLHTISISYKECWTQGKPYHLIFVILNFYVSVHIYVHMQACMYVLLFSF